MNQFKRLYTQNPVFRFMISYTCILILPLLLCLIGYQVSFKIVEGEIKGNSLAAMNNSKNIIDHEIETMQLLVMQIATNPTVNSLVEMKSVGEKDFFIDAATASSRISAFLSYARNIMIEDLYVYLDNTAYVLTPDRKSVV